MASRAFWRDACSVVAAAEYRCANDDDKVSARPPEGALAATTISARKDATTDKGGKAFSFDTFCPLQPLLSCAHRNRTSKHDSQTGLNGADKSVRPEDCELQTREAEDQRPALHPDEDQPADLLGLQCDEDDESGALRARTTPSSLASAAATAPEMPAPAQRTPEI